jgi:hypothetical protein
MRPNHYVERIAHKLRLWVPFAACRYGGSSHQLSQFLKRTPSGLPLRNHVRRLTTKMGSESF